MGSCRLSRQEKKEKKKVFIYLSAGPACLASLDKLASRQTTTTSSKMGIEIVGEKGFCSLERNGLCLFCCAAVLLSSERASLVRLSLDGGQTEDIPPLFNFPGSLWPLIGFQSRLIDPSFFFLFFSFLFSNGIVRPLCPFAGPLCNSRAVTITEKNAGIFTFCRIDGNARSVKLLFVGPIAVALDSSCRPED